MSNYDLYARIGADASKYVREMNEVQRETMETAKTVARTSREASRSLTDMGDASSDVSRQMREAARAQREVMKPHIEQLKKAQMGYYQLTQGLNDYQGSTKDLMGEIKALGAQQKAATDAMMKNNKLLMMSYIQQAATFMNASTHAEKLHWIYQQTNGTLARFTVGALGAAASLQRFANSGSAAQIALEVLGKNADPKKLADFTRNLNASLAQVPVLAAAAVLAFAGLTVAIAKVAKGPDVTKVRDQMNQALIDYQQTLQKRTEEIYNTWSLFEKAQLKHTSGKELLKNLQDQVKIMRDWSQNLSALTKRGVDEGMIAELRKMGPAAAGEIAALTKMSDSQLNEYVKLWKEKHRLAKDASTVELEGLKAETQKKIKELAQSLTPLGKSIERFKSTWASALVPFVKTWGVIFSKIVDAGTAVGKFFDKLNSISPVISTAIFSILYLMTILTLLAIPLALTGKAMLGLRAIAFMFLRPLAPLVSLIASAGTIAFWWAAALVAVGAALYLAWKNSETFRNAVLNAWGALKSGMSGALALVQPMLQKAGEAFKQLGQAVKAAFSGDFSQLSAIFAKLIPTIIAVLVGGIPALIVAASRYLPAIVQGIQSNMPMILQVGQQILTNFINFLTTTLPQFVAIGTQLLTTLISGLTQALPVVLPVLISTLTMLINFITSSLGTLLPLLLQAGVQILMGLIGGIVQSLPALISAVIQIVNLLSGALLQNLPLILQAGIQVLLALVDGITKVLPQLLSLAVDLIVLAANILIDNLPLIIAAGIQILLALIDGITKILPRLIQTGLLLILKVAQVLIQNLPQILAAGVKILQALINGILQMVGQLGSAIQSSVIGKIRDLLGGFSLYDIGKNIIQGLISGISGMAGAVTAEIKRVAGNIKENIKSMLGIHSPSRWMRDVVGKNMMMGWQIGIEHEKAPTVRLAGKMVEWMTPSVPALAGIQYDTPTLSGASVNMVQKVESDRAKAAAGPQSFAKKTPLEIPVIVNGREMVRAFIDDINDLQGQQFAMNNFMRGDRG